MSKKGKTHSENLAKLCFDPNVEEQKKLTGVGKMSPDSVTRVKKYTVAEKRHLEGLPQGFALFRGRLCLGRHSLLYFSSI